MSEEVAPVVVVAAQRGRGPEFRGDADEQDQHARRDRRRRRLPERPAAQETHYDEAHRIVAHQQEGRSAKPPEPGLRSVAAGEVPKSEEHTSELQSRLHLVCRLLLEKKKKTS